jgi:hypothetical protein
MKLLYLIKGNKKDPIGKRAHKDKFIPFNLPTLRMYPRLAPNNITGPKFLDLLMIDLLPKPVHIQPKMINPKHINPINTHYTH